jgi:hypothetical protein
MSQLPAFYRRIYDEFPSEVNINRRCGESPEMTTDFCDNSLV